MLTPVSQKVQPSKLPHSTYSTVQQRCLGYGSVGISAPLIMSFKHATICEIHICGDNKNTLVGRCCPDTNFCSALCEQIFKLNCGPHPSSSTLRRRRNKMMIIYGNVEALSGHRRSQAELCLPCGIRLKYGKKNGAQYLPKAPMQVDATTE